MVHIADYLTNEEAEAFEDINYEAACDADIAKLDAIHSNDPVAYRHAEVAYKNTLRRALLDILIRNPTVPEE